MRGLVMPNEELEGGGAYHGQTEQHFGRCSLGDRLRRQAADLRA